MWWRFLPILIMSVMLSACASTGDPGQDGFLAGVNGILSGDYDRRIDEREQALSAAIAELRISENKRQMLETELKAKRFEYVSIWVEVQKLDEKIQQSAIQVHTLNANSHEQKQALAAIEAKIERLRAECDGIQQKMQGLLTDDSTISTEERYKMLGQERDRLQLEYERLMEYYDALSKAVF